MIQSNLNLYFSSTDEAEIVLDYDYTGIPNPQIDIAKVLFETIGQVIGRSTRASISKNSNFYQLGGNSLNSIFTVTQLRNKGYFIGITEFISSKNLGDILDCITSNRNVDACDNVNIDSRYNTIQLSMEHKETAIR